nr:hypothetical protein [Nonomuraea basaltis]
MQFCGICHSDIHFARGDAWCGGRRRCRADSRSERAGCGRADMGISPRARGHHGGR